jgi:hypothetical protein
MTRDELVALARRSGAFTVTEPEVGIQGRRREVYEFTAQNLERFAAALTVQEVANTVAQFLPPGYTRMETDEEEAVRELLAAERERWAAPVRAMVAAHDAGMVRLNTAMRAQGVDRITLPAEAADEFRAIQALRDLLVGPNVRGKPPKVGLGE